MGKTRRTSWPSTSVRILRLIAARFAVWISMTWSPRRMSTMYGPTPGLQLIARSCVRELERHVQRLLVQHPDRDQAGISTRDRGYAADPGGGEAAVTVRSIGRVEGRLASGRACRAPPDHPPDRAAHAPRRRGHARDHVGDRAFAGDQAPEQGLLGVPGDDHGLAEARPIVRRLPPALQSGPSSSSRRRSRSSVRSTRSWAAPIARTTSRRWSCASTR